MCCIVLKHLSHTMMPDAQGLPPVACSQFDGSDVTPPPLMTLTVRVSFSNTYLVKCYMCSWWERCITYMVSSALAHRLRRA